MIPKTANIRTRRIFRYRVAATLRRLQIKQDTASNEKGGLQKQREHHIILKMYDAMDATAGRKIIPRPGCLYF